MSVTPGKVGELFKSALLYELKRTPVSQSAPIVVAERITDLLALVILTAIGALALDVGAAVTAGGVVLVLALLIVCFVPRLGFATDRSSWICPLHQTLGTGVPGCVPRAPFPHDADLVDDDDASRNRGLVS